MAKRKNRYQKKAAKTAVLAHLNNSLDTHHNVKNSALETAKDLFIGVIGGGLAAAVVGRPSFLIGLGVTGIGHYFNNRIAATFGLGMMAGNSFTGNKSVNGVDGLDGIKERLQAYKQSLAEKTYLSKIVRKPDVTVNGMGDLQYFDYANYSPVSGDFDSINGDFDQVGDLSALDEIERQIEDAGMARLQGAPVGSLQPDMEGFEDGIGDVSEYNY
ncbi:MAG TPA: hypothetical protein VM802_10225 [Chitinophaga sp.]|uniref:hypothetical protein n=1 Tax=Chitinophaga sp. TaxID=1869181 RepID=UPI002CA6D42D|nr:hypothetical protein [Chitinophaga sp.]HVI45239.1 hypothetical protein [Chitinophaga sp.]